MNANQTSHQALQGGHVSHDSHKVHQAGVKHENARNSHKYKEKIFLSSCFSRPPPPTPAKPTRAYPCVYARGGGEKVNHAIGTSRQAGQGEAGGNRRH